MNWQDNWVVITNISPKIGGQGTITKVKARNSDRIGALKKIREEHLKNSERKKRFRREIEILKEIRIQGIPEMYDTNILDGVSDSEDNYVITKWIEGKDLDKYVHGKKVEIKDAFEITISLCKIISECHKKGIIHRDIKPSNIIIEEATNQVYLVDFGISYIKSEEEDESNGITEIGQELGNRFLRLPDLAAGSKKRDERTDLTFIVGILFFLLTKKYPRVILNEKDQMPHEVDIPQFDPTIKTYKRWKLIKRIFDVGFKTSINLRFQNAEMLLSRLSEAASEEVPQSTEAYQSSLNTVREFLHSKIAQEYAEIEKAIYRISMDLQKEVEKLVQEAGLSVAHSGPTITVPGAKCLLQFYFQRRLVMTPQYLIEHSIELKNKERSIVSASMLTSHITEEYYTGPSSDIERLNEEVIKISKRIFVVGSDGLMKKMNGVWENYDS